MSTQQDLINAIKRALIFAVGRRVENEDVQTLYRYASIAYHNARTDGNSHNAALNSALDYIQQAVIFRDMIVKYHC